MAPNSISAVNFENKAIPQLFSRSDVLQYNGKLGKPMWCIIKSSVYDLTPYLDEHPGGFEMIEECAGKDATKAFNDFGHSSYAKKLLESLKIGELFEEKQNEKSDVSSTQKKNEKQMETTEKENSDPDRGSCQFFMTQLTCGIFSC